MLLDTSAYLCPLCLTERYLVGLRGDPIPELLNVQDAFGSRHLLEGSIHACMCSVVATGDEPQAGAANDHAAGRRC